MQARRVAILYESIDGHTEAIARRLQESLQSHGLHVVLARCSQTGPADLDVNGLLVGSSIHAGRHNKKALRFAQQHLEFLRDKPAAHFLVCLTARSPRPEHHAIVAGYLADFSRRSGWQPNLQRAFAGALLYTRYGFFKRKLMESISRKEGGDTDTTRNHVYTDWKAVESFAEEFMRLLPP